MRLTISGSLFLLLMVFAAVAAFAQPAFNSAVPSPRQALGYEPGERFTPHAWIEDYLHTVSAAAPDRMKLVPYGESYEGRTLYVGIFSAPQNLKRLEEIRTAVQRLADPRATSAGEADAIIRTTPVVVWLSYGVHGNESSSPEAALGVIHQLAARTDEAMKKILDSTVVIIDPLLNPDGHERYVNFQITHTGRSPVEDPNAVEHNEDWPSSRTNHYYFDLNRDWSWMTQQETQQRVAIYGAWKPQVHVDYHEMWYNSSYFFFPSFKPVNKNFPQSTVTWGDIFGRANAAAFDAKGWNYWSGEVFDLFYPGYGDAWPSFNGAIGMTYEQAGHAGLRVLRDDETVLTLHDRVERHTATSMATIDAAAGNRKERLKDFYRFFADAIEEGRTGKVRAYLVDPSANPHGALKMVNLLRKQGIEVHKIEKELKTGGLATYFTSTQQSRTFPAGSYLIRTDQPAKRLLTALFEQEPAVSDTFYYDISTWTLPLAYGVPVYWTSNIPSASARLMSDADTLTGSIEGKATYAYLLKWDSNDAVKVLIALLQQDVKANVAMQPFATAGGRKFDRGTIVIPVAGNPESLHDTLAALARRMDVHIAISNSGYTDQGINLGSDRVVRIKKPKIAVITGMPVGAESYGAIWSMFDTQYDLEFVPMKVQQLRYADLHDYTAVIFPDDYGGGYGYRSALDSSAVDKLRAWVQGGGTYIGIEGGAVFASASVGKLASVKLKERKKSGGNDDEASGKDTLTEEDLEKRMTVEQREKKARLESIPGTMVRVRLDRTHPLGFGYDTSVAVLKTTRTMFELTGNGYNPGIYADAPRMSGYMSKENAKRLGGTPFLVHEPMGSGHVVLFADDPNFRLFWDGLNKLFLNSILLMPGIRDVSITAEGHR